MHFIAAMQYDVSALLLFRDDEDHIGTAVEHVVQCLRGAGLRYEIIAVDAGSRDNSVALLSVVRAQCPELRITAAPNPRKAHEFAAELARGRVVWFFESAAAATHGATQEFARAFVDAYQRVSGGQEDLVVHAQRVLGQDSLIAERDHLQRAVRGLRTHGLGLPLGLTTRARLMRMHVDTPRGRWVRRLPVGRWVGPLVNALSLARPH